MEKNIQEVLLSEEQIQAKVQEMAAQLTAEYAGKDPVFIGVLKGVVIFFADMVRKINIPCEIDFMCLSSYGGTSSTGNVIVKNGAQMTIDGGTVSNGVGVNGGNIWVKPNCILAIVSGRVLGGSIYAEGSVTVNDSAEVDSVIKP